MEIVNLKLKDLKPYEQNTKKHPKEQVEDIAESIRQFGWQQPIVVDKNNEIIIGHGRYLASKMMGLDEVPCAIANDLTEEQIKKLRIVDNKTNESEWDLDMLLLELPDLNFDDFNFSFNLENEKEKQKDAIEDDYDLDAADKEVEHRAKLGDIYQLGNHRLMCGDSTNECDVDELVENATIDLLLTDPPYNVDYTANGSRDGIENDSFVSLNDYEQFLSLAFNNADKHLRAGGGILYLFCWQNGI